jgi:hypothetical protein
MHARETNSPTNDVWSATERNEFESDDDDDDDDVAKRPSG